MFIHVFSIIYFQLIHYSSFLLHGCLYQIQRRKQCFSSELLKNIVIKSNIPKMMCQTSFGVLLLYLFLFFIRCKGKWG